MYLKRAKTSWRGLGRRIVTVIVKLRSRGNRICTCHLKRAKVDVSLIGSSTVNSLDFRQSSVNATGWLVSTAKVFPIYCCRLGAVGNRNVCTFQIASKPCLLKLEAISTSCSEIAETDTIPWRQAIVFGWTWDSNVAKLVIGKHRSRSGMTNSWACTEPVLLLVPYDTLKTMLRLLGSARL